MLATAAPIFPVGMTSYVLLDAFVSLSLTSPQTSEMQRVGCFGTTSSSGLHFHFTNSGGVYAIELVLLDGSVVPQSRWNIDKLDGHGPSGLTFFQGTQRLFTVVIQCDNSPFGGFRIGMILDGVLLFVHRVFVTTFNMLNPVHSFGTYVTNTYSDGSINYFLPRPTAILLDGQMIPKYEIYYGPTTITAPITTLAPLLAFQPLLSGMWVDVESVTIRATTSIGARVEARLALVTATWSDVTTSMLQVSTNPSAPSNEYPLQLAYVPGNGVVVLSMEEAFKNKPLSRVIVGGAFAATQAFVLSALSLDAGTTAPLEVTVKFRYYW